MRKLLISLVLLTCFLVNIVSGITTVTPYPEPETTPSTPIEPRIEFLPEDPIVSQPVSADGHHRAVKRVGTLYLREKNSLISIIIGKEVNGKYYKRVDNKYIQITLQEFRLLIR